MVLCCDAAYASTSFLFTPVNNPQNAAKERYNRTHKHIRYGKKFVAFFPLDGIKKTPRTFSHA